MNLLEGLASLDAIIIISSQSFLQTQGDNKIAWASITGTGRQVGNNGRINSWCEYEIDLKQYYHKKSRYSKRSKNQGFGKNNLILSRYSPLSADVSPERRERLVMQFYVNLVFSQWRTFCPFLQSISISLICMQIALE